MKIGLTLLTIGMLLVPFGAFAADYQSFTRDAAVPYSQYKKSLSLTNKIEDAAKAKAAIDAFVTGWTVVADRYGKDRPTVFAAVNDFPALIAKPVQIARDSAALLDKGDVKGAHAKLEDIRYLLWNLRVTNGVNALADRVNSFHEVMEIMLDLADHAKDQAALNGIEGRYGSWFAISWEELKLAPATETGAKGFAEAFAEGRSAIASYRSALRSGDRPAIKTSGNAVKNSYKKIFFMD